MKALRIGGIAILLAAATAYAIDGVVLKYVFKKDAVTKSRIKGSLEIQGTEVTVNMVNQSKVREVAEDGTVTLEDSMVEGKLTFGGQEIDLPAQSANVVVMKSSGEIKEIRGDDINDGSYRVQNLMSFIPPTENVQVGSKWTREIAANKDTKAPAFKGDYNIVGEEKIDGTDTFKIDYKNAETEGSDPASMAGTLWIAKEDCSLVKATTKWTNVPMPASPAPISGNFTIERIK
jgi:hypothetical protein